MLAAAAGAGGADAAAGAAAEGGEDLGRSSVVGAVVAGSVAMPIPEPDVTVQE